MNSQPQHRPNVVAIIRRADGLILVGLCERKDYSEWQLPQGGVDEGETTDEALKREVWEETRLTKIKLISKTTTEIKYDWPKPKVKNGVTYLGQTQVYYLVELTDEDQYPQATKEFHSFDWIRVDEIIPRAIEMRRSVYEQALRELKLI